jgi:hypothetical protein
MQDQDRWIALNRRTVILVSLLGFLALPIRSEARSTSAHKASGAGGAPSARAEARHEGRRRHIAKGKSQHHKKNSVAEATTKTKASPKVPGRARQEKLACAEAFDKAKENVRDSHFRAAKEWFTRCARPTCDSGIRQQCAVFHEKVVAVLPTVVPVVSDDTGATNRQIEVKMDGETLTSNLDGTAIVVDPGDHEFTFVNDGEVFATRRLVIERGQRNQIVSASFQSQRHRSVSLSQTMVAGEQAGAEPAPVQMTEVAEDNVPVDKPAPRVVHGNQPRRASVQADERTGTPWSVYALAGVGLLGVGGYGAFTLKGRADNDALVQGCKPDCSPTSVHHIRNAYLAADISLGIGVAALLASTYLFLRSDSGEESRGSRASNISTLSVAPTSSGALATVGGTF